MSQLEGIRPSGQVTCWCLWTWFVWDLQFGFGLASVNINFCKMSDFYIFYNYYYHYQGQGNRLVGSIILVGPLATGSQAYIAACESRQQLACLRFLEIVLGIKINKLIGCVILPMSLQGSQNHRNWMVTCYVLCTQCYKYTIASRM